MTIQIRDEVIQRAVESALEQTVRNEFASQHGELGRTVRAAASSAGPIAKSVIEASIAAAIGRAVASPRFAQAIEDSIIKLCADRFGGAFDAVLKSAAKRAADDVLKGTAA